MAQERKTAGSGTRFEARIGFSRAIRVGHHVAVSGTAAIGADGGTVGIGDLYAQTVRCLDVVEQTLAKVGASVEDVAIAGASRLGTFGP